MSRVKSNLVGVRFVRHVSEQNLKDRCQARNVKHIAAETIWPPDDIFKYIFLNEIAGFDSNHIDMCFTDAYRRHFR